MLLRTHQLSKNYGSFCALEGLTFTVSPGEIFGLLGPNGSGKSTALRLLLGFLRPSFGDAWIGDHHCWRHSVAARRLVGYLPADLRLYENMTGQQLLRFLSDLHGGANRREVADLVTLLDIDLSRPIAQLSSGMKRKVALLQVLAQHAPLLILDEPTNALDPVMRDQLLHSLRLARQRGQAVLFSSHVLSEVEQVCDRVGILRQGRLVHLQALRDLRHTRRVRITSTTPLSPPPSLPGVLSVQQEAQQLCLEHEGDPQPLLSWLAQHTLLDVTIEPLGLAPIYQRYHGSNL